MKRAGTWWIPAKAGDHLERFKSQRSLSLLEGKEFVPAMEVTAGWFGGRVLPGGHKQEAENLLTPANSLWGFGDSLQQCSHLVISVALKVKEVTGCICLLPLSPQEQGSLLKPH